MSSRLRTAGWIQLAAAIPGTLIFVLYLLQPEEPGRIPLWATAPLLLAASFPLRAGRSWAWYASLLLLPGLPLAPYVDLKNLHGSLHGGESVLWLGRFAGSFVAAILLALLIAGRPSGRLADR